MNDVISKDVKFWVFLVRYLFIFEDILVEVNVYFNFVYIIE